MNNTELSATPRRTIMVRRRDRMIIDAAMSSVAKECEAPSLYRSVALEYMAVGFLSSSCRLRDGELPLVPASRLRWQFWYSPHPRQDDVIELALSEVGLILGPQSTPRDRLLYMCVNRIVWGVCA